MTKKTDWQIEYVVVHPPDEAARRESIVNILLRAAARQRGEEYTPPPKRERKPLPQAAPKPAPPPSTNYRDYLGPEVPVLFDYGGKVMAYGHKPRWMPEDAFREMKRKEDVRYVEGKYPNYSAGHYVVVTREERK